MFIISREALRLRKPKEKKKTLGKMLLNLIITKCIIFYDCLLTVVKNNRLREDLCQYII